MGLSGLLWVGTSAQLLMIGPRSAKELRADTVSKAGNTAGQRK